MTTPSQIDQASVDCPDLDIDVEQDIDWDEAPLKACPKCNHASPTRYGYSRYDSAEMVRIQCAHCGFKDTEQFWCSMETAVQHWNALPRLAEAADELESGSALKAKDLAERASTAMQAKSTARYKCASAKQVAENLRQDEEREPNRLLETLRNTYHERAEELAQEAGECPRSHWGAYLDPDEVAVNQDGLLHRNVGRTADNSKQRRDRMMNTAPNFTYTLVGYREDGTDSCRGCEMGRSGSDFFLSVSFTAEEVAAEWARRLFAEEGSGREYCSFEYTMLLDGRDDNNDPDSWKVEALCNPETGEGWAEEARAWVKTRVAELFAQLKAEKLAADERAKQAKEVQEIGRRERARIDKEAAERAEYLRLQAKFGGPGS